MVTGILAQELTLPTTTFTQYDSDPSALSGCNTNREVITGETLSATACTSDGSTCCAVFWGYGTDYNSTITNVLDSKCLTKAQRSTYTLGGKYANGTESSWTCINTPF